MPVSPASRASRGPIPALAAALVLLALLVLGTPVSTQPAHRRGRTRIGGRDAVAGEILVKYREPRDGDALTRHRAAEANAEADEVEAVGRRGLRRVHSRRYDAAELLQLLQQDPDVEYAEPNYIVTADVTPNDPQFGNLWGLLNTGQNIGGQAGHAGDDIGAPAAWNISTGSRSIVVGIVDTGIEYTHPDLSANVWSAPSQFTVTIAGQSITCAAGTHGFNAITRTCDPMDDNNHGTHVSGTIGGVGNNGVGVTGINWTTSLMGLKFLDANGSGATSDAINAIEFAIQAKAALGAGANVRVLSNSWGGGGYSQALLDEINAANNSNMLFVAAAGNTHSDNDATPNYPSNYTAPNVVAVAATDNNDQLASFSSYGRTTVDLAAPGVNILSTIRNGSYSYFNGTSMATPHVSGAAALVLAACAGLDTAALKANLLANVDAVAGLSTVTATGGRLDVGRAVTSCGRGVSMSADKTAPQRPGTTITWTATASGGTAPYSYRWWVYDGQNWTSSNWDTSNTWAWTPSTSAPYQVFVWMRSANNSTDAYEAYSSASFAITAPAVASVTLSADKASPQAPGTTVTWTAAASGGAAPYSYKFWIYDGQNWTPGNWSASSTFAWTPSANGSYQVFVWAKSNGNGADTYEAYKSAAFTISAPAVSSVTLSANKASPQAPGTTVTWTATATGGAAPYSYKWWVYDGQSWTPGNWTSSNTFAWTPAANGSYQVFVWAKSNGNGADTYEAYKSAAFTISAPAVSSVTLSANKVAPQAPGTTVTWTATATGGAAPLSYRWWVYDGQNWSSSSWSNSNSYAWTPAASAPYQVFVWVKSNGNAADTYEAYKSAAFTISVPTVSSVTLSANKTAPQQPGTTVTWTATATGGTAPYSYRWWVYDGQTWTSGNWTASNTFAWTPAASAAYQVFVWVKSSGNAADTYEAYKSSAFTISVPAVSSATLTANKVAPQPPGTTVTWTVNAAGGTAPYLYRWWVYDGHNWASGAWTASNTFAWTPASSAPYQIFVWVKSNGNSADTYEAYASAPFTVP
jgi:subtilisin family serine protease